MKEGGAALSGKQSAVSIACGIVVFLALLLAPDQSFAATRSLDIAVGGQRVLKLDRTIDRIAIADPGTVDVKVVSSRELRVLGQKEGTTDLTIWFAGSETSLSYHIVVGADLKGLQSEFSRDSALSGVKAVGTGRGVILKGQVYSLEDQQRARSLARSYLGEDVRDMITVADRRMVAVEVRFAAVSTSTLKALGLNFQSLDNNLQIAALGPSSNTGFGYTPGNYNLTNPGNPTGTPPTGELYTGLQPNTDLPIGQAFNLLMAWPGPNILGVISALSRRSSCAAVRMPSSLRAARFRCRCRKADRATQSRSNTKSSAYSSMWRLPFSLTTVSSSR